MLQFILAGATATATDSTAGERERGTLEALLATPAPRSTLLMGKLLATTLTALIAAGFSVLGLCLSAPIALLVTPAGQSTAQSATQQAFGGSLALGLGGLGAVLITAASAALLISALLLTLSLFARSVKEAQTYIAPLTMLIVLPATLLQFADFLKTTAVLYAAPLIGSMLVILDTVKGALSGPHLLLSLGGNVLLAAVLTLIASPAVRARGRGLQEVACEQNAALDLAAAGFRAEVLPPPLPPSPGRRISPSAERIQAKAGRVSGMV